MSRRIMSVAIGLQVALALSGCGKQQTVTYTADVQPLLKKHCVECHLDGGAGAEASGFRVDTYENLMKGTKFGPVIVAGEPLSSSLYRLVAGEVDPSIRMPHGKDPLSEEDIALIETWIEQGAKKD